MQANYSSSGVYLSLYEPTSPWSFFTVEFLAYHVVPYVLLGVFKLSEGARFALDKTLDFRLFIMALLAFPICHFYALQTEEPKISYLAIALLYYVLIFVFYLHWIFLIIWVLNTLSYIFEKNQDRRRRSQAGL